MKHKVIVKKQKTHEVSDDSSDGELSSPVKPKHMKKKKRASPPPATSSAAVASGGVPAASGVHAPQTVAVDLQQLVDFVK